jgi:acetyltransferase-like isoleucine patch superfamily enzyme
MRKYDLLRMLLCGMDFLMRKVISVFGRVRFLVLCSMWGAEWNGVGRFAGKIVMRNTRRGKIRFGNDVSLQSSFRMNPIGPASPCLLDVRPGGEIEIGDGTGMTSTIVSSAQKISIGKYCKIGGGVKILDHNFHAMDSKARRNSGGDSKPREISIGDDVFVGTNAIILKGTRIGARSVIAAGSVVFGLDIPPDSLVRGNPAEVVVRK